ncbi:hypothetical protein HY086_00835 [Candidatus Gottesmanbacteria bacterium]|nr:hypothetical protein [Candidatus Gottesmanbacteria bacterium]
MKKFSIPQQNKYMNDLQATHRVDALITDATTEENLEKVVELLGKAVEINATIPSDNDKS